MLHGVYFDGRSARRVPVSVRRDGDALVISGESMLLTYPLAQLRVDPRVGDTRRAIHLPDGGQVQSGDHTALDELFPQQSRIEAWVNALERRWGYALAGLLVIALAAWYAIVHGLPFAAEQVAQHIPVGVEESLGEQTLAALDRTLLAPSKLSPARELELQQRFARFTTGMNDGYRYRLAFRSGRIGPNALALPGGTIVMTDALVGMAQNDQQLLAVLAHEIGHVRGRHGLRTVLQGAGVAALISTLAGDAVSITTLAATLPTVLTQTSYSREFETEADSYAFEHLKAHGLSPRYFAEMMLLLEKRAGQKTNGDKTVNYLSTHPDTDERIRRALENQ